MLVETHKPDVRGGQSANQQALDTQAALLPYALAVFTVTMPAYVWAGSHAPNAAWMTATFAIFALAWGYYYAAVSWLKRPDIRADDNRRGQAHLVGGLIWAGAVAQIAAFAEGAGPAREALMMALASAPVEA